jgi:hypothetical protein
VTWHTGNVIDLQNQNYQTYSILEHTDVFGVLNYSRDDLEATFRQRNAHILEIPRGGGMWLWKPWVIQDALRMIPEGDRLFYADAGTSLTPNSQTVLKREEDFTVLTGIRLNLNCLKKDILWMLHVPTDEWAKILRDDHIWTTFLVMKNTPAVRDFVGGWLGCTETIRVDSDLPSILHKETGCYIDNTAEENTLYIAERRNQESTHPLRIRKNPELWFWWHHRRSSGQSLF